MCFCFVWGGVGQGCSSVYLCMHMDTLQWLDRRWGISGAGEGEEKEEEDGSLWGSV